MPAPRGRTRSGTTARTVAQAKINLSLRVLAREASGYHQLETIFCRLELGDDVAVHTGARGRALDVRGESLPPEGLGPVERNLAWRAAEAFATVRGWPNDWAIEIEKRIPVGGGLGGGSADAGAVLRCLNALAPDPLSPSELLSVAGSLGADVPFLTLGEPLALAWGRGDRLMPLPAPPARSVALACSPVGVSTAHAYAWLDEARSDHIPHAAALDRQTLGDWPSFAKVAHNDFEAVVPPRFPLIADTLRALRGRAAGAGDAGAFALLAGSGATVFLIAQPLPDLRAMLDPTVRVVETRTATRVVTVEVSD